MTTMDSSSSSSSSNDNHSDSDNRQSPANHSNDPSALMEDVSTEELFQKCGYNAQDLASAVEAERDVLGTMSSSSSSLTTSGKTASWSDYHSYNNNNNTEEEEETDTKLHIAPKDALEEFHQALAMLPAAKREALDQVKQLNPTLIELESPPLLFLNGAGLNVWKGAEQLAHYWTQRRLIMGDRYHLPLRLHDDQYSEDNPNSCLTRHTDECLKRGGLFWAKKKDQYGRHVFILDDIKFHPFNFYPDKDQIASQSMFYLCQALWLEMGGGSFVVPAFISLDHGPHCMRPTSGFLPVLQAKIFPNIRQQSFLVIIHNLQAPLSSTGRSSNQDKNNKSVQSLTTTTTLTSSSSSAQSTTIPTTTTTTSTSNLAAHLFIEALKLIVSAWSFSKARMRIHNNIHNQQEVLQTLASYGLSKHHVPKDYWGGYEDDQEWVKQRLAVERVRYDSGLSRHQQTDSTTTSNATPPSLSMKMADFHNWASRHLENVTLQKMESEEETQAKQNEVLRQDLEFMESQLACTSFIAEQHEHDRQQIINLLALFISPVGSSTDKDDEEEEGSCETTAFQNKKKEDEEYQRFSSKVLAQTLFEHYILFLGRRPNTGQWILLTKPNLSQEHQSISIRMQLYLWEEQQKMKSTLASSLTRAGEQSTLTQQDLNDDNDCSDNDLDVKLKDLQAKVDELRDHKNFQQKTSSFLESATCFSTHLTNRLQDFAAEHRPLLVEAYSSILTKMRGRSSTDADLAAETARLADSVLANQTCFDIGNHQAVNGGVTVAKRLLTKNPSDGGAVSSAGTNNQALMEEYLMLIGLYQSPVTNHHATLVLESAAGHTMATREDRKRTFPQEFSASEPRGDDEERQARQQQYRLRRKKMLKRL